MIWLPRRIVALLAIVAVSAVGVLVSPRSLADDSTPSVLTKLRAWVTTQGELRQAPPPVLTALRIWVATHTGPNQPQPSASIQSQPPASQVASAPTNTTQAPAGSDVASRPAATVNYPSGCGAALAYLAAHAAPGFISLCPHADGGYQATTTCVGAPQCEQGTAFIWIADPCPAAYMNEASNSWVLVGRSSARIDPYGYCGEPGNPYG